MKAETVKATLGTIAGIIMLYGWIVWNPPEPRQPKQHYTTDEAITCHAGTERLVSRADEYPAWEIECENDVRVVIVD